MIPPCLWTYSDALGCVKVTLDVPSIDVSPGPCDLFHTRLEEKFVDNTALIRRAGVPTDRANQP